MHYEALEMKRITCAVAAFVAEDAVNLTGSTAGSVPVGISVGGLKQRDGEDTLLITVTKPGHETLVAMLTLEQFNLLAHLAADIIESWNAVDCPHRPETVQ